MLTAPIPPNESARMARLRLLNILDSQPEERFDRLTRMARHLFSCNIATVTLIDSDRQWFKSRVGTDDTEGPRGTSFCGHAILTDDLLFVPDATQDERFHDNPLVLGNPNIRFYAGYPLRVGEYNLGTLCVIDDKPREFTAEEQAILRDLAHMAEQELTAIQQATTDHLTTLSNRNGFETLARHSLSVATRLQLPATLLFFDLNRFKQINDTHGHAAGDAALRLFANALLSVFRASDVIGRLGGDEFVVLLSGSNAADTAESLHRLRGWLGEHSGEINIGDIVRFSVGSLEFDPAQHRNIEDMLREADALMYANKKSTREARQ